jgi:hypothetical protein
MPSGESENYQPEPKVPRGLPWPLLMLTYAAVVILIYMVVHMLWPMDNRFIRH